MSVLVFKDAELNAAMLSASRLSDFSLSPLRDYVRLWARLEVKKKQGLAIAEDRLSLIELLRKWLQDAEGKRTEDCESIRPFLSALAKPGRKFTCVTRSDTSAAAWIVGTQEDACRHVRMALWCLSTGNEAAANIVFDEMSHELREMDLSRVLVEIEAEFAQFERNIDPPPHPAGAENPSPEEPGQKTKKSTQKGDAEAKLIGALTEHHKYCNGGCQNKEPAQNNELARTADVDKSTASDFFTKFFIKKGEEGSGYKKYRTLCRQDFGKILDMLKLMNNDFCVDDLYGGAPPNEAERRD